VREHADLLLVGEVPLVRRERERSLRCVVARDRASRSTERAAMTLPSSSRTAPDESAMPKMSLLGMYVYDFIDERFASSGLLPAL